MENFHVSLIASMTSTTLFTPLELLRTKLALQQSPQSSNVKSIVQSIYQREGLKGFYRGLQIGLLTTPIYNAFYLSLYEVLKTKLKASGVQQYSLISSLSTGIICNTITYPLWILKTRIQASNKTKQIDIFQSLKKIYHAEGVRGYYKGLCSSYMWLTNQAVFFPLYETSKNNIQQRKQKLESHDFMLASIFSKFFATLTTYPSTLFTTKIQCSKQENSLISVVKKIYKEKGFRGFFQGVKVDLLRSIPSNTITFLIYENFKQTKFV